MQRRIDRREFIKQSSLIGASTLAAGSMIPSLIPRMAWGLPGDSDVDLSVVRGENRYDSTIHAVDLLG